MEIDDDLAFVQHRLARPGRDILDRQLPSARGSGDGAGAPGGDHRGHAVGGGRGVAEVAARARASLDLGRAHQLHGLDDARPGPLERRVLSEFRAGDRGADAKATVNLRDLAHLADVLDVDDERRLHVTGAQLGRADRCRRRARAHRLRRPPEGRPLRRSNAGPRNAWRLPRLFPEHRRGPFSGLGKRSGRWQARMVRTALDRPYLLAQGGHSQIGCFGSVASGGDRRLAAAPRPPRAQRLSRRATSSCSKRASAGPPLMRTPDPWCARAITAVG